MAEQDRDHEKARESGGGGTATAKPKRSAKKSPQTRPPQLLPPWKVLLHNDPKNEILFVIKTVMELTPLKEHDATLRTEEAHRTGVSLLLVTHKERAELYKEQFASKGLTVSIEAAEE
ncbi:MAG TPA: ATP-dependent Clp protease adaptor ClpS [Tepidisphaeraceae bacterium]|nr:ATP-dependent Clp protease adaptor ClpS [Tepidisphaeraceae bacterium]